MLNVNKVQLLSERTSGVPPIIFLLLNLKAKESSNFCFEKDVLIRRRKTGEGRTNQTKKGIDGKQNIHRETKRQREGSQKIYGKKRSVTGARGSFTANVDVIGGAGKSVTEDADGSFTVGAEVTGGAEGSSTSSPPKRRVRLGRKKILLFQRISNKQDRG